MENFEMATTTRKVEEAAEQIKDKYEAQDVPIGSYLALMGIYATVFGGLFLITKAKLKEFKRPSLSEFALLTIGSFKLSRVVTMSTIASPLRAPFTTRGKSLKGGEVQDEARGEGLQKAIGYLVTCPFCFNVWAATGFAFMHALAPAFALRLGQIFTSAAVNDTVDLAYQALRGKNPT